MEALAVAKARLGDRATAIEWLVADATAWLPQRQYDLWHDRGAFHFLTDDGDRAAYIDRLTKGVKSGGRAIIGTFAPDGPQSCSGLPVVRYDAESLRQTLGDTFELLSSLRHDHATPWGSAQHFQFSTFRRVV